VAVVFLALIMPLDTVDRVTGWASSPWKASSVNPKGLECLAKSRF